MGHEFVGEVIDHGPGVDVDAFPLGARVTSSPVLDCNGTFRIIGCSPEAPGGFGELMLVQDVFARVIPPHVPIDHAALADPLSVGDYYVHACGIDANRFPSSSAPEASGCASWSRSLAEVCVASSSRTTVPIASPRRGPSARHTPWIRASARRTSSGTRSCSAIPTRRRSWQVRPRRARGASCSSSSGSPVCSTASSANARPTRTSSPAAVRPRATTSPRRWRRRRESACSSVVARHLADFGRGRRRARRRGDRPDSDHRDGGRPRRGARRVRSRRRARGRRAS